MSAIPVSAVSRPSWADRGRNVVWRHPEWWSLAIAVVAAAGLVMVHASAFDLARGMSLSHHAPASPPSLLAGATFVLAQWLLMVVAMMVPLSVAAIRTTAARSLWRRRHRSIAAFLAGFVVPWALTGVAISIGIAAWMPDGARTTGVITAVTFAVAFLWQRLPATRRALMACHGTRPLAPTGWAATRDAAAFGLSIGGHCVISCWVLMLGCAVSGHHPLVMLGAAAVGVAERTAPRRR